MFNEVHKTNNPNTWSVGATFKSALKATNEGPVEIEASMRIRCFGPCTVADAGSPKHDSITSILQVLSWLQTNGVVLLWTCGRDSRNRCNLTRRLVGKWIYSL